jgi:hypothetical protein
VPSEKFVGRCGTLVVVDGDVDVNGDEKRNSTKRR